MSTILSLTQESTSRIIQEAAECLAGGGVLAVGTESFYALSASAFHPEAVARVAALKGRSSSKPILTLIGHLVQLPLLVDVIPPIAQVCMTQFWPGPLTLVLNTSVALPRELLSGTSMVGVRQPDSAFLRSLVIKTGPVTGTSANLSGSPPACTAFEVRDQFPIGLDLIIDTGLAPGGEPSTILEIGQTVSILRHGPITQNQISRVLATHGCCLSNEGGPSLPRSREEGS